MREVYRHQNLALKSFLVLLLLSATACSSTNSANNLRSPLQIRSMQTRTFPVRDSHIVMKAVLNALQDDGYMAKNAVSDLGLLTATKETNYQGSASMIVNSILMGSNARWPKTVVIEANANISSFGKETKLRISFVQKTLDNSGATMHVEELNDPLFFQTFFAKVDQSVFYQKEQI